MRRPSAARQALGFSPLMQASGADASRIKGIPRMTALAEPLVFFSWQPTAQRAADLRAGSVSVSLNVAVGNNRGSVSCGTHTFLPFLEGHSFRMSYKTHGQERTENYIRCQAKTRPPLRNTGVVDEEVMDEVKGAVTNKSSDH
jgi:hypothetical protein